MGKNGRGPQVRLPLRDGPGHLFRFSVSIIPVPGSVVIELARFPERPSRDGLEGRRRGRPRERFPLCPRRPAVDISEVRSRVLARVGK